MQQQKHKLSINTDPPPSAFQFFPHPEADKPFFHLNLLAGNSNFFAQNQVTQQGTSFFYFQNMISALKCNCRLAILITLILLSANNVFTKTNYAANIDMKKIFCIIPIGHIDNKILQYTQMELEKRFNVAVDIGRQQEEPAYAYHKHKKQYNSTKILKKIHNLKLTGYDRILGLVDVDLYVPERTFVFGGADVKKKVSVISLTRLTQKFYDLPEDTALFEHRIIIEAVHELGHTYGLYHCNNNKCVMFLSNTISDTDHKGAELCSNCKKIMEGKKDILKQE